MKSLLIITLFALSFTANAQDNNRQPNKKEIATVANVDGYYIYLFSKPTIEYEFLGRVKPGMTQNGFPSQLFNKILKRAKQEYPKCDAIIFDNDMEAADCIRFKD